MAWSYSGNPASSDKDKYRFSIGDTIQSEPVLQDEEIDFILLEYQDKNSRLYYLFQAAANTFSREYKRSLGPQSEDPSKRLEHFQAQMEKYRKIVMASGLSLPTYQSPKIFSKGMHNNV
jgi:hypothetical protein